MHRRIDAHHSPRGTSRAASSQPPLTHHRPKGRLPMTSSATAASTSAVDADERPADVVLEAASVTLRYGSVTALKDVSFTVRSGEVVALVGPNGAGKTSFFNCVSGFSRPSEGTLTFAGLDLGTARRHAIAQ